MTAQERIRADAGLGFTDRQARFLVTVMTHSGVCLPRHYTSLAGIVYGQKTRRFFAKLAADGHASTCRCLHNRAAVYHVHGAALYRAFGEPHCRLRRPLPLAAVVPRLMLLDAVLASPKTTWLDDDEDRRLHLGTALDGLLHRMLGTAAVGLGRDGSLVLVSVVTAPSVALLRALLRRLRPLFDAVPSARLRLFHPAHLRPPLERQEGDAEPVLDALRAQLGRVPGDLAKRLTFESLPHKYSHLLPLVAGGRIPDLVAVEGEQVGEQRSARSRPPSQRIPMSATPARQTPPRAALHAASSPHSPTW